MSIGIPIEEQLRSTFFFLFTLQFRNIESVVYNRMVVNERQNVKCGKRKVCFLTQEIMDYELTLVEIYL